MYITVIIIAYDRKQFIIDAAKSVINQSLSKEKYEIIVIKNYRNDLIDEFISKNGILNIVSNDKSLSGKIIEALEIAKGEIISFLEDDDRFHNDKLEVVLTNFENVPNLVYYHNGSVFEDDKRNELPFSFDSPSFNLSSITIKRTMLNIEGLKAMSSAVDTYIYFNAIDSGGILKIDNTILTYYRYHNNLGYCTKDFTTYLEHKLVSLNGNIEDYRLIVTYLKTDRALKIIYNNIITIKINASIICKLLNKETKYVISAKEILFWLSYPTYYDRKFPLIFKSIKYLEMIMPNRVKSTLEKIDFEKSKRKYGS